MRCAWKELMTILPPWIRDKIDRTSRETALELRLRQGEEPEIVTKEASQWIDGRVTADDLIFVVNAASRYSPWAAETVAKGFITAQGGHRIGLCGDAACYQDTPTAMRQISSLCIRVARDFPGVAKNAGTLENSTLIIGAPGWGKTTLLRDICRKIAVSQTISVVDERGELFPDGIIRGRRMDVLRGCTKDRGIDRLMRTMGPAWIAVDEITAEEDCAAIQHASNCGVKLLATAHASSVHDFHNRAIYRPLIENEIFSKLLVLHSDKTYHTEGVGAWN